MITLEAIRHHFPALHDKCYLNSAAESIPPIAVGDALSEYWRDKQLGMDGRDAHFAKEAEAKTHAATLLGLTPEEVAFCSCTSEAYNLLASALQLQADDEVIVSDIDFPSGFTPWLTASSPPSMQFWKSVNGALELESLEELLSPRTRLVQVSLVSFYNGWRIPWEPFIRLVRERAPQAVVSVDLTQALGRCVLDFEGADIVVSSTHKWLLGLHGSCVVGVPHRRAAALTTTAGGWYHIRNAFHEDRFHHADQKPGAASFAVGMPSFGPIYALNASMKFLLSVGVKSLADFSDPLVEEVYRGLVERGIAPLAPLTASGIVAFKHPEADRLHAALKQDNVHVMHQAGRLRVALHGYNTQEDVQRLFASLDANLP